MTVIFVKPLTQRAKYFDVIPAETFDTTEHRFTPPSEGTTVAIHETVSSGLHV